MVEALKFALLYNININQLSLQTVRINTEFAHLCSIKK